jgi:hypothetical protein
MFHKWRWWQFSLRRLFALMTVVALLCAFLLLPTIRARRFVSAVQGGRHDVACQMCPSLEQVSDDTWRMKDVRAGLAYLTLKEAVCGKRCFWLAYETHFFLFQATPTEIRLMYCTMD